MLASSVVVNYNTMNNASLFLNLFSWGTAIVYLSDNKRLDTQQRKPYRIGNRSEKNIKARIARAGAMVVAYTAQMNECYRRLYQLLRPDKLPVAVELPRWK
jgi:hypothetical protein